MKIRIDRRTMLQYLGINAAAIAAGSLGRAANVFAAEAPNKAFAVTTVNHLSYASADYKVTRDFYVDLFGMRDVWDDGTKCQLDCGPEDAPNSFYLTPAKPGTEPTVSPDALKPYSYASILATAFGRSPLSSASPSTLNEASPNFRPLPSFWNGAS